MLRRDFLRSVAAALGVACVPLVVKAPRATEAQITWKVSCDDRLSSVIKWANQQIIQSLSLPAAMT